MLPSLLNMLSPKEQMDILSSEILKIGQESYERNISPHLFITAQIDALLRFAKATVRPDSDLSPVEAVIAALRLHPLGKEKANG